jgi:hypothetical protein
MLPFVNVKTTLPSTRETKKSKSIGKAAGFPNALMSGTNGYRNEGNGRREYDLGTTQCDGSIMLLQPFVVGTTNARGGDEYCYPSPLWFWKYPSGGNTTEVFWPGSRGPAAQTVSFPPK